jgi:hypothetical protein
MQFVGKDHLQASITSSDSPVVRGRLGGDFVGDFLLFFLTLSGQSFLHLWSVIFFVIVFKLVI